VHKCQLEQGNNIAHSIGYTLLALDGSSDLFGSAVNAAFICCENLTAHLVSMIEAG
jgi:hypothetical protein